MAEPSGQYEISWNCTFQGHVMHGAMCQKDELIIVQSDSLRGAEIVPRRLNAVLTVEDKKQLERVNLSPENWSDEGSIMKARMDKDSTYTVVEVERSKPGQPLSKEKTLKKVQDMMKTTLKAGSKRSVTRVLQKCMIQTNDYNTLATLHLQLAFIIMDQDGEILVTGASKMAT